MKMQKIHYYLGALIAIATLVIAYRQYESHPTVRRGARVVADAALAIAAIA